MRANGVPSLAQVIVEAYVNEVCLDRALKGKFLSSEKAANALPQYKIMPLFSLWKRHGRKFLLMLLVLRLLLLPALAVAAIGNVAIAGVSLFRKRHSVADLPDSISLPNTNSVKLFHYLFDDFDQRVSFRCKMPWGMLPYLSAGDHLRAIFIVWRVLIVICFYREQYGVRRRDLIFHSIDVVPLTWFSLFIEKAALAGKSFITDCNLQRWDYIATQLTDRCSIIQHAYIHGDLEFVHEFGSVDCLYIFDAEFEAVFARYYKFGASAIISPRLDLQQVGEGKRVLFLASSAPYLQFEIEFIRRVKSDLDYFVVIKLHPRHVYESSVEQLVALADKMLSASCFPDCECMVSYDSFLGYEYKALGKKVVFLKDESSIQAFLEGLDTSAESLNGMA